MKWIKFICLIIGSGTLFLTACNNETCEYAPYTTQTVDATIHWTGDYAVDGCGYIIEFGNKRHKAENEEVIPNTFKKTEPTEVEIKLTDYYKEVKVCMGGISMNSIKILDIRKK